MNRLTFLLISLIFMQVNATENSLFGNSVVDSEAKIEVSVNDATEQELESIVVTAAYSNLFTESGTLNRVQLLRSGDKFSAIIDVDTEVTRALITLYSPRDLQSGPSAMGVINIRAEETTEIELNYDDLHFFIISDPASPTDLWAEEQAIQQLLEYSPLRPTELINDEANLSDWQHFGRLINLIAEDQMTILSESLASEPSPTALNTLHQLIGGNWILNAGSRYSFLSGNDCPTNEIKLPAEFYRPLNEIDFSADFLNHSLLLTPRYILDKILDAEIFAIDLIGDTPVAEWQSAVNTSLGKVIDNPTPLLLDLLAAASYMRQIDNNNTLSPAQISNIDSWSNRPLAAIVLRANDNVSAILKEASGELYDLSDHPVSLAAIIEKYRGKRILVDLWNTWCAPCSEARKIMESVTLPDDAIIIGIADTSSDQAEWQAIAARQRGPQYLISEEEARVIAEKYSLSGIPAFLVFDADGRLIYKGVGTEATHRALDALR